ncbi:MAG: M48 family metalloprotease [Gemmatimonadota bacterium]|nr:M48 family metalloprotease [Gemmatimonadota bacterium]
MRNDHARHGRMASPARRLAGPAAALAIGLLSGCAVNPATGSSMLSLVSESREIEMGQEFKVQVDQQQGIYDESPELSAYVDSVGQALAAVSERPDLPWSFQIADEPVVNAFALPGGPIYLARGLLAHFSSEAEMASVLGHEIGHITARHIVEAISRQQLAQLGFVAGMLAVPELQPFSNELGGALGVLFLKFGRDDESQSDALGFRYMTRLGYDPVEAVTMFQVLDRLRAESGRDVPEWQSTHPDPGNRVADARARVDSAGNPGGIVRTDVYLDRIDGLVWGEDPREGYFQEQRFIHPELAFEFTLPEGWEKRNTRQAVLARSPENDAAFELTLAQGTPDAAARAFFAQQGVDGRGTTRRTVNGLPAVVGTFRASTQSGTLEGLVSFIEHGGNTYRLLGYAPASRIGRHSTSLERTLDSFREVTERRLLDVEPQRIDVVTVEEPMSAERFLERYPSEAEHADVLRINGLQPAEWIEAGTKLKRIVGTGGPTR